MAKTKVNEKGVPCGAREHMPLWYPLIWSSRGVANAINVIFVGYVTFYCTDILGLSALIVGGMLVASKIIDAFTDLGIGYLIDRTHTRFGKARPYEFFIIFQWLLTIIMFSIPDVSPAMQYVFVFILYLLVNAICVTALGGADAVYMSRTFTTDGNRIVAMSVNGVIVMFFSIAFNIAFPQLLATLGTTKAGWTQMAAMLGIPLAAIGMLRFIFCKEVVKDDAMEDAHTGQQKKAGNNTFGETFAAITKNRFLIILVGMMIIINVMNGMGTVTTYYFKYIMGDVGLISLASLTSLIAPVGLIFFPALAKKFGTTKILQVCAGLGIIGMAIRTVGGPNIITIIIGGMFFGLALMPLSLMINAYIIDCMDYGEWKTGIRVEGMIASVVNFSGKVGSAVASGVVGIVMGLAGYDGSLAVQPQGATSAIVGLYNLLPLALCVVMLVLAMMYQVDKYRPQMEADLKAKHS